jgi:hypothetical protein
MQTIATHPASDLSEEILILGEHFTVHHENSEIFLLHPKWSLSGKGNSISAALINLFEEGDEIYSVYNAIPPSQLSPEAKEMLNYLKKLEEHG